MKLLNYVKKLKTAIRNTANAHLHLERQLLLLGRFYAETVKSKGAIASLNEVEFKVFSQHGDDGIIQWLIHNIEFPYKTFIEFGVENYRESNTRFLMMNNNWWLYLNVMW